MFIQCHLLRNHLTQQPIVSIHPLEGLKLKTLTNMWSRGNSPSLPVGVQNGTSTLEESWAVSWKLFILSSSLAPWSLTKWIEKVCPHRNLHTHVYNSFIQNHPNLAATKMSFSRWMDKQTVIHPHNGMLFLHKKKWTSKPWKDMEEF